MTIKLQEAMYPGTGILLEELGVSFIEFDHSLQKHDDLEFIAYPVTHAPPSNPHGIRIAWGGGAIAFSGDTAWDNNLLKLADQTELFILECNDVKGNPNGHLSLETIEKYAKDMGTKRLMLSHMGPEMLTMKQCPWERLEDGMELELW
jgi:ribonuclease BN (tRNA processing enzyme)